MKLFVVVLGILLCETPNVRTTRFYEHIFEKISGYVQVAARALRDIGVRIKKFIHDNTEGFRIKKRPIEYVATRSEFYNKKEKVPNKYNDNNKKQDVKEVTSEKPALLSTPQLAALHGKKVESHVISTKDGYLLTLHRIAVDKSSNINSSVGSRETVLLHHGLLGSSADWILLGPTRSLPYILSSIGYDVWMINARGNYYSRGHMHMKVDDDAYWKFSFHEIGIYDIPATLKYIQTVKNCTDKINFIGHSMGATTLLVLLSMQPKYNNYLKKAILIAPLVFMKNVAGPLKLFTSLPMEFGDGEFLHQRKIPSKIASIYCKTENLYCANPLFFFSGMPHYENWDDSFISTLFNHVPAGGSVNTILHYFQLVQTGKFHSFGPTYSEYPLNEVTVPIALLSSSEDLISTVPDVLTLYDSIRSPIDNYVIHGRHVSHTDFVWGSKADTFVFPRVLEYLKLSSNDTVSLKNYV